MAKQIIILARSVGNDGPAWQVALWAFVPVAKQPFWSGKQVASVWSGANAAENLAISTGAVREIVETFTTGAGLTLAQIQAALIQHAVDWQTEVNGDATFGRYGTFYDGVIWTAGGA